MGGCTLTGALAVTTAVTDAVTIIHGPPGCAHHNFSLFFSTALGNDEISLPSIASSGLSGTDVIFGGEDALRSAITRAVSRKPGIIYVLTSCVAATIGDDVDAVCSNTDAGAPITVIPTEGFLGGDFSRGFSEALIALSSGCEPGETGPVVNIIGEKNLESGADVHFAEVSRLLSTMGLSPNVRFVRNMESRDTALLGSACINILRDPSLVPVGETLARSLGIPSVNGFPTGLSGTLRFLEDVGKACDHEWSRAVSREEASHEALIRDFPDLAGSRVRFVPGIVPEAEELAVRLGLVRDDAGIPLPVPFPFPVGTAGCRKLLHRWRRAIRA